MDGLAPGKVHREQDRSRNHQVDQFIDAKIDESRRLLWRAELVRGVLGLLLGVNAFALFWLILDQWIYSPGPLLRSVALFSLVALVGAYGWRQLIPILRSTIEPEYAAKAVENELPGCRQSLLSYLTLREHSRQDNLQGSVLRSLAVESRKQLQQHDSIPQEAAGTVKWWFAAIASFAVLAAYVLGSPKSSVQAMARLGAPLADIATPLRVSIDEIDPMDAEVTAGRTVEISAHVEGLYSDETVSCYWKSSSSEETFELVFDSTTDRHHAILPIPYTATGFIDYQIFAGDATAGPFRLAIQDIPVVAIDRIEYVPPAYTKDEVFSKSVGAIRAIDGTEIEIHAKVNRPIKRAKVEFNPTLLGGRIQATAGVQEMQVDATGTQVSLLFNLRSAAKVAGIPEKASYRIVVSDVNDQQNMNPIIYPIEIIPDLPPEINITLPSNTPKDLPINAQQLVQLHASDPDYGLSKIELEIHYGNSKTLTPVLWESKEGTRGHQVASIPIRPEELKLRIGDTIELIGIATDNRSSSDQSPLKPNIVRTDPIELRIAAPGSLPDTDDPSADGVSKPEPTNDNSMSSPSESDQDAGGAGSGGSGDASTTSSQSGDNQGESGSSSSNSPTEGEDPSTEDSKNGSGGSNQDNSPSESDSNSDSDQTSGANGENQSTSSMTESQVNGDDQTPNQSPSDASNPPNPDQDNEQTENTGQTENNSQASDDGQASTPDGGHSDTTGSDPSNQNTPSANNDSTDTSSSDSSANTDQPQTKPNNESLNQTGSPEDPSNGSQSAEKPRTKAGHDGEAFERIRDFLEEQKNTRNQSSDQDSEENPGNNPSSLTNNEANKRPENESAGDSTSDSDREKTDGVKSPTESGSNSTGDASDGQSSANEQSPNEAKPDKKGNDLENETRPPADGSTEIEDPSQASKTQDGSQSNSENGESTGDDPSAEAKKDGDKNSGESRTASDQTGDSDTSETSSENREEQESGKTDQREKDRNNNPESSESAGSPQQNENSTQSSMGQEATEQSSAMPSDGEEVFGDDSLENPQLPDEVNLDYAKQATDLVLDYLEENREHLDPDLLDQLQWNEQELLDFLNRWSLIRELPKTGSENGNQELEETLKSLGLRDPNSISTQNREAADSLRSIRDGGYSQPVPAAYRDAFNSFRRAMNRSE